MSIYTKRVERMRHAMREWGVDLIFLNYGPDFTYISGILKPIYYEILKTEGDFNLHFLYNGIVHFGKLYFHYIFPLAKAQRRKVFPLCGAKFCFFSDGLYPLANVFKIMFCVKFYSVHLLSRRPARYCGIFSDKCKNRKSRENYYP